MNMFTHQPGEVHNEPPHLSRLVYLRRMRPEGSQSLDICGIEIGAARQADKLAAEHFNLCIILYGGLVAFYFKEVCSVDGSMPFFLGFPAAFRRPSQLKSGAL